MRRDELEHIIRAAAEVSGATDIVIVGSQALLGAYPDRPDSLGFSMEADVYPRNSTGTHPEAIVVNLGETSRFHDTHGIYAELVGPETVVGPEGWEARLIPVRSADTGNATGWCLEPHDLLLAKLARGEAKDHEFAVELVGYGLVRPDVLRDRADQMPERFRPQVKEALDATFRHVARNTGATVTPARHLKPLDTDPDLGYDRAPTRYQQPGSGPERDA
jgi:hypothetical protein